MAKYMLSVHMVEGQPAPSQERMAEMYQDVETFNGELRASGGWVFAGGLPPADTATVVRADDCGITTTDGPFAETKEQLGGFWVIRATDLDAALEVAGRASRACGAPVEVRPFQDEPEA